jgi:hypothetical protein
MLFVALGLLVNPVAVTLHLNPLPNPRLSLSKKPLLLMLEVMQVPWPIHCHLHLLVVVVRRLRLGGWEDLCSSFCYCWDCVGLFFEEPRGGDKTLTTGLFGDY